MKKRIVAIYIVLCMITVFTPNAVVFAEENSAYNSTNSTYSEHTPTTYVVGSGYESGDGYWCYDGPSIDILVPGGKADKDKILLYKGDIIEFVGEMPAAGVKKATHGLFKGFRFIINEIDVTSQFVEPLESYSAPRGKVYQKVKVISDKVFYLTYKGAGPTGEETYGGPDIFYSNRLYYYCPTEVNQDSTVVTLIQGVKATNISFLKAVPTRGKITLTYSKSAGYNLDGYYIYKSTKKTTGFKYIGKTANKKYLTTKSIKSGKTYYYKVKGYRTIDGEKVFTKTRTVKVIAR